MVPGIILAAGRSTRMGRSKALLPVSDSGPTFVARIVQTILDGGVADAIVVGRPDDMALQVELDRLGHPVRFIPNPQADLGQLSSLITGLNAADHPGTTGILVTLVDLPLVTVPTVQKLLFVFAQSGAPIVRAIHHGRHGHPVIFGRTVFDELRRADPAAGAKAVVHHHDRDVLDVEVEDAGILIDVDVPEDYERIRDRI